MINYSVIMPKQQEIQSKVKGLPTTPGIYTFLGETNNILYIGKATSLRNRVRSYFTLDIAEKRSPLIAKMVEEIANIKFEQTESVLEALILEAREIKKHLPPYNTALKDQRSWNYVVITDEEFPRVLLRRERELERNPQELNIKYKFGPFTNGGQLREAMKIVRKIFPFRDKCMPLQINRKINPQNYPLEQTDYFSAEKYPPSPTGRGPKVALEDNTSDLFKTVKGCFNYQIGLCPGVCAGVISQKEYKKIIENIKTFFEGKKGKLISDLEKDMKALAKQKDFEKADEIKKKVFALKHIHDIALIKNDSEPTSQSFRIESYDVAHISGESRVGVMTVIENGEINKNEYRMFNIKREESRGDTGAIKEIIERRMGHSEWLLPNLIVVDGGEQQLSAARSVLQKLNLNIALVSVVKDERHKPREILGDPKMATAYEKQILLANNESHRFAITFHRKKRKKNFL